MAGALGRRGAQELRDVARDLRFAASPRGMRAHLRKGISAALLPMKKAVQANATSIPTHGSKQTGLRQAIAKATRISIKPGTGGRAVLVRLLVDGKKMPEGQQALPAYMEGSTGSRTVRWRHPVYGPHASKTWVSQESHPYFAPAVAEHLPAVEAGVLAAVDETATQLAKGGL